MFFFLPLGLEGGRVRLPVIGALVALLCLAAFLPTWVFNRSTDGYDAEKFEHALQYWEERPYLEVPAVLAQRMDEAGRRAVARERQQWLEQHHPPADDVVEEEQRSLDAELAAAFLGAERNLLRRLALVPAKGFFQVGWLTHMFIHFGWLHLLGNLLFLWVVGPLLEEAWGRRLFAAFYLVGGLLAALAHFLLDRHSQGSMGGASGAIAACMGAFAVRFATKRVRVAYLVALGIRFFRGIVNVPAWLAGLAWFGSEVFSLVGGDHDGVAVAAHVGGFVFGAGIALGMKAIGLERDFVTMEESGPLTESVLPEVIDARNALGTGDREGARRLLAQALAGHANDFDARWELVQLELADRQPARAAAEAERGLVSLLRDGQAERAVGCLLSVWRSLSAEDFSPGFSFQLARAAEATEGAREMTLALYRRAGDEPTAMGVKALVRYVELGVGHEAPGGLREALDQVKETPELPKELQARIAALESKVRAAVEAAPVPAGASVAAPGLELARAPLERSRADPAGAWAGWRLRIVPVVVKGLTADGLTVEANGQSRALPFAQVKALSAAVLPVVEDAARSRLVVDLVMSWAHEEQAGTVVRLDSQTSGLHLFLTAATPQAAWHQFVNGVLKRSPAQAIPAAEALAAGRYPRFRDEAELLAALAQHAPGAEL